MTALVDDVTIPLDIANTVVDPQAYASDRAQEAFRWLRAHNPLGLAAPENYEPFWIVTKLDDIKEVGLNNKLYASGDRQIILTSREDMERVNAARQGQNAAKNLIQMDPPEHAKYRLITQSWFLPQNLRKIEGEVRATAR